MINQTDKGHRYTKFDFFQTKDPNLWMVLMIEERPQTNFTLMTGMGDTEFHARADAAYDVIYRGDTLEPDEWPITETPVGLYRNDLGLMHFDPDGDYRSYPEYHPDADDFVADLRKQIPLLETREIYPVQLIFRMYQEKLENPDNLHGSEDLNLNKTFWDNLGTMEGALARETPLSANWYHALTHY